ncbi:hypothetical protein KSP40_PGU000961 [Platanthera guangdongensis]|uniref:Uncharacterized protein n=1 Tax=Platanthera guangdongensis TaxID=2320717 RepID=A0ABR2M2P2_9ASPA
MTEHSQSATKIASHQRPCLYLSSSILIVKVSPTFKDRKRVIVVAVSHLLEKVQPCVSILEVWKRERRRGVWRENIVTGNKCENFGKIEKICKKLKCGNKGVWACYHTARFSLSLSAALLVLGEMELKGERGNEEMKYRGGWEMVTSTGSQDDRAEVGTSIWEFSAISTWMYIICSARGAQLLREGAGSDRGKELNM